LVSIIGGMKLWGVLGLIYGPLIVALLLIALDFYLERTKQLSLFEEKNER
jgi:predicted PurR-regulated permease PerM